MENLIRKCKKCGKELTYSCLWAFNRAEKCDSLCRECASRNRAKRKCDLTSLLEESNIAYYWVGFLLADGHFQDGRITLSLSIKDKTIKLLKKGFKGVDISKELGVSQAYVSKIKKNLQP